MAAERDLSKLLTGMSPELQVGEFGFVCLTEAEPDLLAQALMSFKEAEGLTLILPWEVCEPLGGEFRSAMITLKIHSALEAVGLTAAVSAALTQASIPCNVVAAFHHDHLFAPVDKADQAMEALLALTR